MTDERRANRMVGCASLGRGMLAGGAVVLAVFCFLNLKHCFFIRDTSGFKLRVRRSVKDLEMALEVYKADYNRFPPPATSAPNSDLTLRSRGPVLQALIDGEAGGLSPKKIKYLDLPMARNRKDGLWKDDAEWVLSDLWGEPYYIVLDTNGDGKIANPEFGADQSDARYAANCKINPPPATLPKKALIYSSGPDRDPKTWHDNVCSWQAR